MVALKAETENVTLSAADYSWDDHTSSGWEWALISHSPDFPDIQLLLPTLLDHTQEIRFPVPFLSLSLLTSPHLSSPLRAISRPPSPPPSIPLSIQPFQKPTRTSTILTQRASPIHSSAKEQGRQQCCRRWQNISRDSANHQPPLRGVGSQPPRTRLQAPNRVMWTPTAHSSTGGDFSRAISRPQHEYIITEDDPSGHDWSHIYRYPTDDRETMESKPHALWLVRYRATPFLESVLNDGECFVHAEGLRHADVDRYCMPSTVDPSVEQTNRGTNSHISSGCVVSKREKQDATHRWRVEGGAFVSITSPHDHTITQHARNCLVVVVLL